MTLNCERDEFRFGGSISVAGDYIIGESDDVVTEKLRQDLRLLQFSKHQIIRKSSRYTNYRTLGYKRNLEDTRKVFQHEHLVKVNEDARARMKITKIQQQYRQKLKKSSLSSPMFQEAAPSLINNVPRTEVKLTEIKKEWLACELDEGKFHNPLSNGGISLGSNVLMNSAVYFEEKEDVKTFNKRRNAKDVLTEGSELSIVSSKNRSSQMPSKEVIKKLPSVNLHHTDPHLSAQPLTICTSDNSDRVFKQAEKLTQHQKIKYDWKKKEGHRTVKMWNEFERIMLSVSECLQIEYKPLRWFISKHEERLKKGQINVSDKSDSRFKNNFFLRSYYFPYGKPDEIVFKL